MRAPFAPPGFALHRTHILEPRVVYEIIVIQPSGGPDRRQSWGLPGSVLRQPLEERLGLLLVEGLDHRTRRVLGVQQSHQSRGAWFGETSLAWARNSSSIVEQARKIPSGAQSFSVLHCPM